MPENAREFRLGDLLSFTLDAPLGPNVSALLGHLVGPRVIMQTALPSVLHQCTTAIVQQHPWVGGIHSPGWLRPHDWAALWAWIDTLELKHGVYHQVLPITNLRMPEVRVQEVPFEDLPPEIQAHLRSLGFEGLGGGDPLG